MESIKQRIEQVLEELRSFINADGGDVTLVNIENNNVYVRLMGACKGCPLSFYTLTVGLERSIKEAVPTIERVIAVE